MYIYIYIHLWVACEISLRKKTLQDVIGCFRRIHPANTNSKEGIEATLSLGVGLPTSLTLTIHRVIRVGTVTLDV